MQIDQLRSQFSGDIIQPDDEAYEQVRSTMFVIGSPKLVLQPRNADDVVAAIKYANAQSLAISVRSGGHNGAGFSTNDGGVVIDMVHLNTVEVFDTAKHLVRVGAGARWGNVAKTLQAEGLAISSGDTASVGVGGLTLGGGIGWMVRKYGLAIDSLVGAEIVTADGEVLHISDESHPDLFWAIRGGNGNFGIVTQFEFAAHPIGKVFFGTLHYDLDDALDALLKGWRDYMRVAPEDLTTTLLLTPSFGNNPAGVVITCCYAGEDAQAEAKAIEPLLQLGKLQLSTIAKKDYAGVLEEVHAPPGVKVVTKNVFVPEMSDALIDAIVDLYRDGHGPVLQIRSIGGAMSRVANDATAFHHRKTEALMVSPVFLAPNVSDEDIAKALEPWYTIARFGKGAYGNLMTTSTAEDVTDIYPPAAYQRLATVKKRYDPKNLFSHTHNVAVG